MPGLVAQPVALGVPRGSKGLVHPKPVQKWGAGMVGWRTLWVAVCS